MPYKGLVHNLETKTDPHSYLVKGFVVHNCGSKTPHFLTTYGFEGLHGRALPVATGAKLVNPGLTVIVTAGDGDTYGIGGNHLIHAMRRNLDITVIVQNNAVYGLTKGQYSPTSIKGFKSPSTPAGALEEPVNPMALGIIMGATYVARGFAYEARHLIELLKGAIQHKGFSMIDIFQPCSTYNKIQTIQWYKENIKKMDEGHDPADIAQALKMAMTWEPGNVPIGLFYQEEGRPTYDEQAGRAVVNDDITKTDISPILARAK
ncbi:MAG: 2-oxoacid ferredoxin oxidoreductase [Candidatus Aenigmarchaeota archaeon]|nr:2-oxoacid ferredoxin oxidoreductase [Candidatus Aenigmarchaeota archaeon]